MDREESSQNGRSFHLWEFQAVKDLFWIVMAAVLLIVFYHSRMVLLPLFLGLLLAYLFHPLISFIKNRWRIPAAVTISLILVAVTGLVAAAAFGLAPILIDQGKSLIENLPDYLETLRDNYGLPARIVPENPQDLFSRLNMDTGTVLPFLESIIGTSVMVFIWLIIIPFSFFVFSLHFDSLVKRAGDLIPARQKERVFRILGRMDEAVGSFFRGRLIISLIIALLFSAGWFLVGVPYWFVLGTATGLMSMVPYLSSVGWIAAVLVKYLDMHAGNGASGFDWLAVLVWPTVVFQGVNILEEYVLTPWIQSKSTSLNPLTILVVVIIGGMAGGLLGLLFAIPMAACVKIFIEEVLWPKTELPS